MEEFKKNIKKSVYLQLVPYFLLIGVVVFVLFQTLASRNMDVSELPSVLIMFTLLGGAFYWFNKHKISLPSYWIDKIENAPEDIVWIKPVEIKTKLVVVTVARSLTYDLYTIDNKVLVIHSSHFRSGELISHLKEALPDSHYGYSREVKKFYKKNPKEFIQTLKQSNLCAAMKDYKS